MRTLMQELIRQLPEVQQRAVYCVYFKQLSIGQTAALEGCSINTIKTRLFYARDTLRQAILAEEKRTGDNAATISDVILTESASTAVTIPAALDGWPVVEIGWHAFEFCPVTAVTIPDSGTTLSSMVFYGWPGWFGMQY